MSADTPRDRSWSVVRSAALLVRLAETVDRIPCAALLSVRQVGLLHWASSIGVDARLTSLDAPGKPGAAAAAQRDSAGRRVQAELRSATASGSHSRSDC